MGHHVTTILLLIMKSRLQTTDCHCVCVYGQVTQGYLNSIYSGQGPRHLEKRHVWGGGGANLATLICAQKSTCFSIRSVNPLILTIELGLLASHCSINEKYHFKGSQLPDVLHETFEIRLFFFFFLSFLN